jgi:phosphohistidine phosphatase
MYLYVFRHGEAKSKDEDPERGLTDRGQEEVSAVCRVFSRIKPAVDAIWHSGKKRAEQTADILAAELSGSASVLSQSGLNPNDPAPSLVQQLEAQNSDLVIVGHLPQLAKLISLLLIGSERSLLDLPAAGLVCLEGTGGSWQLNWYLTPELC